MGIDIYARWRGQTLDEIAAQTRAGFSVEAGCTGYLREGVESHSGVTPEEAASNIDFAGHSSLTVLYYVNSDDCRTKTRDQDQDEA